MASNYNTQITIQSRATAVDNHGHATVSGWTNLSSVYCNAKLSSRDYMSEDGVYVVVNNAVLDMWYASWIQLQYRFQLFGKQYEIVSIEPDERRLRMRVKARLVE